MTAGATESEVPSDAFVVNVNDTCDAGMQSHGKQTLCISSENNALFFTIDAEGSSRETNLFRCNYGVILKYLHMYILFSVRSINASA